MKIIHCADLHLDAHMTSLLPQDKAKIRKRELVNAFVRMVEYGAANGVSAIIIAGDMFDTGRILVMTKNYVLGAINGHPNIDFYYLSGNHDSDNFIADLEEKPANLHIFSKDWTKYQLAGEGRIKVSIYGAELTSKNADTLCLGLQPDISEFNIVTLHGQVSESVAGGKAENINLKQLRDKGIDYIALGHIHSYREEALDSRCTWCYCGCLEGRGFDEIGDHGFVLLDIDERTGSYKRSFIKTNSRNISQTEVDISELDSTFKVIDRISRELEKLNPDYSGLMRVVLTGKIPLEAEINIQMIEDTFRDRFFFFTVKNQTKLDFQKAVSEYDTSLRGEFIRTVQNDMGISDEDKQEILKIGLQGFLGEDFE